jgi:hypothetical protein
VKTPTEYGFFRNVIDLCKTPFMIGVTVVAGLAFAMNGFVALAHDHRSGEEICVDAGGDWIDAYGNCDMPPKGDQ